MSTVHLTINDQSVTAQVGQTILEAAKATGIDIPTLCHHPAVSNHGACRMCLVEVKGMRGLQTACTCPVAEGMEVQTDTDVVIEGRRFALELLFSERNHYCMYCQVSGDCELQALAYRYGLDHWRYNRTYQKMAVDASHPYIIVDPNRCVLCTRCVRACAEIAANHTLGLRERGFDSMIMADLGVPLGESSCVSCGMCLQVCPTGALIDAHSAYGGHEEDLTHTRTTCMQCSVGCALDVVTRGSRLLRVDGVWDAGPSGGLLCAAGRFEPLYEERQRITTPLIRQRNRQRAATWDEALGLVAEKMRGGSSLGLAACATTNEALAAFARLFERAGGEAGRVEPVAPAFDLAEPAQIRDILASDFIVVAGADPLNDQRVVGYFVRRAVDKGARVALIGDPKNDLAQVATWVVSPRSAQDVAEEAAEEAVEEAIKAASPVVIYGVGLKPATTRALKPLVGKARFLALDPARNGRGALEAGLAPLALSRADVLYFLVGEEHTDEALVDDLDGAFTVVQGSYQSPLTQRADVVLPTPIWAERTGHVTNVEGQVLPVNGAVPMPGGVRDDAKVLAELANLLAR